MISDELLTWFVQVMNWYVGALVGPLGLLFNVINIVVFIKLGFSDTTNISLLSLAVADTGVLLTTVGYCVMHSPPRSRHDGQGSQGRAELFGAGLVAHPVQPDRRALDGLHHDGAIFVRRVAISSEISDHASANNRCCREHLRVYDVQQHPNFLSQSNRYKLQPGAERNRLRPGDAAKLGRSRKRDPDRSHDRADDVVRRGRRVHPRVDSVARQGLEVEDRDDVVVVAVGVRYERRRVQSGQAAGQDHRPHIHRVHRLPAADGGRQPGDDLRQGLQHQGKFQERVRVHVHRLLLPGRRQLDRDDLHLFQTEFPIQGSIRGTL
ncbi:unnamed protein product [Lymnaea stagnalis]|uniref:G-protein coupled receptors family 1 profile domain-containing protein n=1 Tax=Lymnaea stagnalis TaxID=6523 RepID=A0AAV2HVS4_LYMST